MSRYDPETTKAITANPLAAVLWCRPYHSGPIRGAVVVAVDDPSGTSRLIPVSREPSLSCPPSGPVFSPIPVRPVPSCLLLAGALARADRVRFSSPSRSPEPEFVRVLAVIGGF